ncbi:MAG: hypothetical protein ACRDNZ_04820 [Streptosporangiaceae bacterium]
MLISARVHPETATTPAQVRAEFGRLNAVVSGSAASSAGYQASMAELRIAMDAHPGMTVGRRSRSLSAPSGA